MSSPNIAGGKFWNLDKDFYITIGSQNNRYGLELYKSDDYGEYRLFGIYNGDYGPVFMGDKHSFLLINLWSSGEFDNNEIIPVVEAEGRWDFSKATVTGLSGGSGGSVTAVFG